MTNATFALLAAADPTTIANNLKTTAIAIIGALLICVIGWKLLKAVLAGGTGAIVSIAFLAGLAVFILANPQRLGDLVDAALRSIGV